MRESKRRRRRGDEGEEEDDDDDEEEEEEEEDDDDDDEEEEEEEEEEDDDDDDDDDDNDDDDATSKQRQDNSPAVPKSTLLDVCRLNALDKDVVVTISEDVTGVQEEKKQHTHTHTHHNRRLCLCTKQQQRNVRGQACSSCFGSDAGVKVRGNRPRTTPDNWHVGIFVLAVCREDVGLNREKLCVNELDRVLNGGQKMGRWMSE